MAPDVNSLTTRAPHGLALLELHVQSKSLSHEHTSRRNATETGLPN